jgi:adenosylhomocysteine nucleosidase
MPPKTRPPVIAVTGLAFEARIAKGPGVLSVLGTQPAPLAATLTATIKQGCQGIISFGIAGGLAPHLRPGDCIVARSVVMGERRLQTHADWSKRLLEAIPGSVHADIAGVHAPVVSPAEKRSMAHSTGAAAVDMESFVSIDAAVSHGLPFAAVRVVADPSYRALPPAAIGTLLADGTPDLSAVMRSVIAQPRQLSALIRIALDARAARAKLTRLRGRIGSGFGLHDLADALFTPAE